MWCCQLPVHNTVHGHLESRHLLSNVRSILGMVGMLLITTTYAAEDGNEIMGFNGPNEPIIDPIRVCKNYSNLNQQQINICRRYPLATASAMQGIQLAIHECRRQFAGYRWNCSNLDNTISGKHGLLNTGYKEASYTQAIAAAGVLHQIARACALGKVQGCGCDKDHYITDFEWKGCSHDLAFGAKFSRRFLQSQRDKTQSTMQAHNSKIGRKAVIDQKSTKCKCHGMSSSCEIKTCWLSTPDFQVVGSRLKSLYSKSVLINKLHNKRGSSSTVSSAEVTSSAVQYRKDGSLNKKMVHFKRSPTYCDPIPEIGVLGTSGRVCNSTTTNRDSCSALCCGRGYFTKKVRRVEKCNCKFHWCCFVVCEKCEYDEWVTVCK